MKKIIFGMVFVFLCTNLQCEQLQNVVAVDHMLENEDETRRVSLGVQDESKKFYEAYVAKYYPRALVIRNDFFDNKDPVKVAGALYAFINVLADQPWFYFTDKPEGFKLSRYWEFIVDQCALINGYLKIAYIDLETNVVYVPTGVSYNYFAAQRMKKKVRRLIDFLKEHHNEVLGAFYAFSYDAVVRLFNEGVLFKDFAQVERYYADLKFIMGKIQNTPFEAEYQEYMSIAQRLRDVIKKRFRGGADQLSVNCYDDVESAGERMRNGFLLERTR